VTETGGTWAKAEEVPGIAPLSTGVSGSSATSVSCTSAGTCTAAGWYDPGSPGAEVVDSQAFVADETGGTWAKAEEVPGTAALNVAADGQANSVSCASAGNCSVGGTYASSSSDDSYRQQAFVADETSGTWAKAEEVPNTATLNVKGDAQVISVSCTSPGNCSAGGFYTDAEFGQQAFVVDETSGTWGKAEEIPGTGHLNAGRYSQVNSLSCASPTSCAVGGYYTTSAITEQAFIATKSVVAPTSTAATVSAATVIYGNEQAEKVTVTVSAGSGGTPSGTVTVASGSTSVCVITLTSGKGSCTLTARKLPPGSYHLVATYGGSAGFGGSASAAKTVTVAKAASKTSLALSAAKVSYGHENREHLTVTVSLRYSGTPGGKVTVKAGSTTICTISLASGKGSCTLTAKKLRAGTYHLIASYPGSADFRGSASAAKTLTVTK
jgi:hypothetical protein